MNAHSFITPAILLAALLAAPAFAADGDTVLKPVRATAQPDTIRGEKAVRLLALETGLTPKNVRMVSNTVFRHANYQFRIDKQTGQRFEEALGQERYTRWAGGHPIPLYSAAVIEAARGFAGTAPRSGEAVAVMVATNP